MLPLSDRIAIPRFAARGHLVKMRSMLMGLSKTPEGVDGPSSF